MADPKLEKIAGEAAARLAYNEDTHEVMEPLCLFARVEILAALQEAVSARDMEWTRSLFPEGVEKPITPEKLKAHVGSVIYRAVAEERKALRDGIGSLCNIRAISWSAADDEHSNDYREGIEHAAIQLRDSIRSLIDARTGL